MPEAVVLIPVFAAVFAAGLRQWWTGALSESARGADRPSSVSIRAGGELGSGCREANRPRHVSKGPTRITRIPGVTSRGTHRRR